MKTRVNLIEVSDLLFFAEEIGYKYSDACKIIESKELMLHVWELGKAHFDKSDFVPPKYSEDVIKICLGFMKKEKIKNFTLLQD